jgi:hypothetical protein
MANTFELIASSTVGAGGAASIDFTSIPSTYTDLVLELSLRFNDSNSNLQLQYNGATTSFSRRQLTGNGTSATSASASDAYIGAIGNSTYTANTFGSSTIYIPNYAGSANKSASADNVTENNSTGAVSNIVAHLWSNTAAITSIKLSDLSGISTFVQYSTAYLYGVKNA